MRLWALILRKEIAIHFLPVPERRGEILFVGDGWIRASTILFRLRWKARLKLGEVRALPPFAGKKRRVETNHYGRIKGGPPPNSSRTNVRIEFQKMNITLAPAWRQAVCK